MSLDDLTPVSNAEKYLAKIAGEDAELPAPVSNMEKYLAKMAGEDVELPPPVSRLEKFAAKAAEGGGGGVTVEPITIMENKTVEAPEGTAYNPVTVNVPNTYAAGDEGKVVSQGALVAQTSTTITENGTVDTTLNNQVVVDVQAGGNGIIWLTQDVDETPLTVKVAGVTTIPQYMFYNPNASTGIYIKTTQIDLPSGLTSIGAYAFRYLRALRSINIPSGVTSIGDYAFDECQYLQSVELPNGITSIGSYAFHNCQRVVIPSLPSSLTRIEDWTFNTCSALALTSLPSGITYIGNNVFAGCSNLALTSLPSGLTSMGDYVFYNCREITFTSLPSGITSIGSSAFQGCTNLAITSIPSGITSIPSTAFRDCTSLTELTFKGDITSIAASAFRGCSNILKYDFTNNTAVPTLANVNAFTNINANCKIIVPDSLYNDWIAANNWSTYASYIVKESEYTV